MEKGSFKLAVLRNWGMKSSFEVRSPNQKTIMQKQDFEVEVLVNGSPVREYWKDGRTFVEGRKGQEYSLRIRNNGWRRILAVPSVDGLSVINGQVADVAGSPGYVIGPHDSVEISGWRKSNDDVARFVFSDKEKSYANRKGKDENRGVIGVAMFYEKIQSFVEFPAYPLNMFSAQARRIIDEANEILDKSIFGGQKPFSTGNINDAMMYNSSEPACYNLRADNSGNFSLSKIDAKDQVSDLGTGWGENKFSPVKDVEFKKDSEFPSAIFEIFYATKDALKDLGIDVGVKPAYIYPSAFGGSFCEPPRS